MDELLGFDGSNTVGAGRRVVESPERSGEDVHARAQGGFVLLSVDAVRPNEHQPRKRFDDEDLAGLVLSISSLGVLQPILVRHIDRDRYELIAGERRWRAAQLAGLSAIPVVLKDVSDEQASAMALIEEVWPGFPAGDPVSGD